MAITIPPVPYKAALTDNTGRISAAWAGFFKELFLRVGGSIAPSNSELNTNTETIETSVASLQTTASDLATRVVVLEGLGQGRQL